MHLFCSVYMQLCVISCLGSSFWFLYIWLLIYGRLMLVYFWFVVPYCMSYSASVWFFYWMISAVAFFYFFRFLGLCLKWSLIPSIVWFMQKPSGLLSLLDEESNFPNATDLTLANKLKQHLSSSPCFKAERGRAFGIHHYAGEVSLALC